MVVDPVGGGTPDVGYIASAAYSPTLARTLAYAWLPHTVAVGSAVRVDYLGTEYTARVVTDPVVDPDGTRLRGVGTMVGAAAGDLTGSGTTDTMGPDAMG